MTGGRYQPAIPAGCRWCNQPLEEHTAERQPGAPPTACHGLSERFLPYGSAPKLNADREYDVHCVKLLLCEGCLLGLGDCCHTPACALCRHDSPGFPLTPELYEVVTDDEEQG